MNKNTNMAASWLDYIKKNLANNDTVIYREIEVNEGIIHMVYDMSACDHKVISEFIILPVLTTNKSFSDIESVKDKILASSVILDVNTKEDALDLILSGNVLILFGFLNKSVACYAADFPTRPIDIPSTETVIKGPRAGFNESLADSVSSIRNKIKDPNLKFERFTLGDKSKTQVVLAYIEGNAHSSLVNYIKGKMEHIQSDYIFYSSYIEEELKCRNTPFDTIGYTEKPDAVAISLAEGKVAIIVDGSPSVSLAPYFFIENFHSSDDYTTNKFMSNMGVILRLFSFFLSTLVPGLYIALFTHHFNLIPYIFVFRVAASRAGVPFPMVIEVLIMIVFFQILREAGVRLPQQIGPTLSIVGALILGEAAVQSGLTSHVTVLVAALTSIASFLVPSLSTGIFFWNVIIILFSSFLGLPGFYTGFVLLCSHIAGLTSCGYPYLYPLGTLRQFKYKELLLITGDLDEINEYIFIKDDGKK